MHAKLKEAPHCLNCQNLKMKKGSHHCSEHWDGFMYPETAGHLVLKIGEDHNLYKILCGKYRPKEHVKVNE